MDIHYKKDLTGLAQNGVINGDVIIRDGVEVIKGVRRIKGSLGITSRTFKSLGSLEEVEGDLWVSLADEPSKLESLGHLKSVGGDFNVRACLVLDSLGALSFVGGSFNIRNTQIRSLNCPLTVKGNAQFPKEMEDSIDPGMLHIEGKVSFCKFKDQYQEREEPISILKLREEEFNFGRNVITGELATKIGRISDFTSFGRANIEQIYPFIEKEIEYFIAERKLRTFLDAFFDGRHPYRKDICGFFNSEYYRQFYPDDATFEFYRGLYSSLNYKCSDTWTCLVFQHAITEQLTKFFRIAEDKFRVSIGIPKIGEGWVSETDLFYKLKEAFPSYAIVQHARPSWLGMQHLDIFFVDKNIAVEYQGLQHYQPVAIFGGEEGFEKTKQRDRIKLQKCQANGCHLLYVDESMSFAQVEEEITKLLKDNHSTLTEE